MHDTWNHVGFCALWCEMTAAKVCRKRWNSSQSCINILELRGILDDCEDVSLWKKVFGRHCKEDLFVWAVKIIWKLTNCYYESWSNLRVDFSHGSWVELFQRKILNKAYRNVFWAFRGRSWCEYKTKSFERKSFHNDSGTDAFGPNAQVSCELAGKFSIQIERNNQTRHRNTFHAHFCPNVSSSENESYWESDCKLVLKDFVILDVKKLSFCHQKINEIVFASSENFSDK
jgi:hypothetical protein